MGSWWTARVSGEADGPPWHRAAPSGQFPDVADQQFVERRLVVSQSAPDASPRSDPLTAARRLEGDDGHDVLTQAARAAGAHLVRHRLRSVHHRAGRSHSRVYDATIEVERTPIEALLVAHVDVRPPPDGALVMESDGDEVTVWRFPQDPWLPGLPSTVDPRRVRELLDSLGVAPGEVVLRTRAYRPTRRAVVEVTVTGEVGNGRILYFKVLAGRRATELAGIHAALQPHLPVPGVVGVDEDGGILALEAMGGRTLRAALVDDDSLPEPAAILEMSDAMADISVPSRRDPTLFADPRRHVPDLVQLLPDTADPLRRIVGRIEQVSPRRDSTVHGDLHDGQLLVRNGCISGLLDVDGAGTGWQAHDAGSLVANVEAIGLVWPSATQRALAYSEALAAAWRPMIGAEPLAAATASAWIGLATGPWRAQEPGWQDATRRRISRAAEVLEG